MSDKKAFNLDSTNLVGILISVLLVVILCFGFMLYHDHAIKETKLEFYKRGKEEGMVKAQDRFNAVLEERKQSKKKVSYIFQFDTRRCDECMRNEKIWAEMINNEDF